MKTFVTTLIALFMLVSCSSEPQYADLEEYEKTQQLREQYGPLLVGTWHYEYLSDGHHFFEQVTFKDDGTFTGMRKWQTRKLVTIDGEQHYTDWESVELLEGPFTGTWSLRYYNPEGLGSSKRNCLLLNATYDENSQYVAYPSVLNFDYADETTLRIQGCYYHDADGWTNYQRGEAEPSFGADE